MFQVRGHNYLLPYSVFTVCPYQHICLSLNMYTCKVFWIERVYNTPVEGIVDTVDLKSLQVSFFLLTPYHFFFFVKVQERPSPITYDLSFHVHILHFHWDFFIFYYMRSVSLIVKTASCKQLTNSEYQK